MIGSPASRDLPDWHLIRAFIAVMETGSLSRAARRLGATQPTIGRQIRQLETSTGDTLFLRRGLRLEPTEHAMALLPRALDVERAVVSLAHAFSTDGAADGTRRVRITLPTLLADEMLPHILPRLTDSAPDASFEIMPSDTVQDLLRRDADIALRLTAPVQPDLVARKLTDIRVGLYAARAYLKGRAIPATPADLAACRLILSDDDALTQREGARLGLETGALGNVIRCADLRHRLALLRAGLGVSHCQHWIAAGDDRLVRLLPEIDLPAMPLWLVATDDVRRSRTLRAVVDRLAVEAAAFLDARRH